MPISDETQAHDRRLRRGRTEDLPAAGADHAQQRQLTGPLADDDRERVQDGESTDEERDEGEHEKSGREERQRLVDGARLLVRPRSDP